MHPPPRCDEIPDEGVEVLVLRGLLTAATSATFALHGQVRARVRSCLKTVCRSAAAAAALARPRSTHSSVSLPTAAPPLQALLLAVRTCYNIHLMSRSEVNQTTAKATLTQARAGDARAISSCLLLYLALLRD